MNFSVLMSIYEEEKADYFNRAMISIWDEQTIKPSEIVLVEDGKLIEDLYNIIKIWKSKLGKILKIIPLEKNLGTGDAKNIGLENCTYELVAIMDTDDISVKDRFEKQLKVFENNNIDVCSGYIAEFTIDESKIISYRKIQELHNDIVKFSKKRMPINHVATMFKRDVANYVGGYKKMIWFEDYYLSVRIILNGGKFYNIQEALVNVRVGEEQLNRRSGFKYAINEIIFQKELLNLKHINYFEFIRNVSIRFIARIVPTILLKKIYEKLRTFK